ncbi:MAG: hypothetical protein Q7R45_14490 [Sulfuricaulis sp.]|nr:hypothetical protein [Sulfuricaulis sp.]
MSTVLVTPVYASYITPVDASHFVTPEYASYIVTPADTGVQAVSHFVSLVSGVRRNDERAVFTGMTKSGPRCTPG